MAVARPGVIGVGVRDDGAVDGPDGVDIKPARLAIKPVGQNPEPSLRMRPHG